MSASRAAILGRIRRANAGREAPAPPPHPMPARAKGDAETLKARFRAALVRAGATHETVAEIGAVAAAAAARLAKAGKPAAVVAALDAALDACGWAAAPGLAVRRGVPGPDDAASVTGAVAGIAETGTLMVRSGSDVSMRLHFLPDLHIAVLAASAICGSYEDAFARLLPPGAALPRMVTLVTGPSRSSDIERILQIGVHGPRALHVVIVDGR